MGLLYKIKTGKVIGISVEDRRLAENIMKLLEVLGHNARIIHYDDVWGVIVDEK